MDWNIIFSGIVSISTFVYAILTWRLVNETRKARKSQFEPYILITLSSGEANHKHIFFNISNIGLGLAKNVTFKVLRQFESFKTHNLNDVQYLKNGFKNFPSRKEVKGYIGFVDNTLRGEELNDNFIIRVSYEDIFGTKKQEIFTLPLSELEMGYKLEPSETYLGQIKESIDKLTKQIEYYAKNTRGL